MFDRNNVFGRSGVRKAVRNRGVRTRRAVAVAAVATVEALEARQLLAAQLVTATPTGTVADLATTQYSVSSDGRYVAFTSAGTNFVAGRVDDNFLTDIYWRDTQTGTTRLVSQSVTNIGHSAGGRSNNARISADGQYVAFLSAATDLVTGLTDANAGDDVFLYSVATSTVTCMSVDQTGVATLDSGSTEVAMRDNGLHVAFVSDATNADAAVTDTNTFSDVFVRDVAAATTKVISVVPLAATTGTGASSGISINGQAPYRVAFISDASDIVVALTDTNSASDVFVYDSASDTILPVSVMASSTVTGNGASISPVISFNGNTVAYLSASTDLVGPFPDNNGADDLFAFDVTTSVNELVSIRADGTETADAAATSPTLDDDGSAIAWVSAATDLEVGLTDTGGFDDVFLRDRLSSTTLLASRNSWGTLGDAASSAPSINYNGSRVAFLSLARNLAPNVPDTAAPRRNDVFTRDMINGSTRTLSAASDNSIIGNAASSAPQIARRERAAGTGAFYVYFLSGASNLITNDFNFSQDLFRGQSRAKQVPAAPINVQGTVTSTSTVDLSWTDNSIDEAKFKVLRSTDGVNFEIITKIAANAIENDTETFTDTGLIIGQTYYYRILATNDQGDSDFATTLQVNMPTPAVIAGTVWSDKNLNGRRDANEIPVIGATVYADLDNDGSLTAGEPSFVSDINGNYLLIQVPSGPVIIRENLPVAHAAVTPSGGSQVVTVTGGQVVRNVDFYNHDYGVAYKLVLHGEYTDASYVHPALDAMEFYTINIDGFGDVNTIFLTNFQQDYLPWTTGNQYYPDLTLTRVGTTNEFVGEYAALSNNWVKDRDGPGQSSGGERIELWLTIDSSGYHSLEGRSYAIDAAGNRKDLDQYSGTIESSIQGHEI